MGRPHLFSLRSPHLHNGFLRRWNCLGNLSSASVPELHRMSTATPNQALQRTAPHVTAAASSLRLSATMQPPRRAPRSLSLRSLGV